MKFIPVIFSILSVATALPAAEAEAEPAALEERASIAPNKPRFYLKSKSDKSQFDGLFVESYHTGAGLGDAVLSKSHGGWEAFLSNGHIEFDTGNDFPWSLNFGYNTYAAWAPMTIDAGGSGKASGPYRFTSKGLVAGDSSTSWGGWLACNWWHGVPQLFYLNKYYDPRILVSCAEVELHRVPV